MDFSGFNFDGIAPKPGSPSKMAGSDGVAAPGGMLWTGERNSRLIGDEKWLTFTNAIRGTLIIAASYRAYDTFARSVKWFAEPNPAGGRKAKKMADIATDGLLEASMPKPWTAIVGKTATGSKFQGFCMHEWQGRRRETPGRPWVFTNLDHRPQHTIAQWLKPNEREPWVGVVQRTKTGGVYPISRARLFYMHDDTLTDDPSGAGYLQHLIEAADKQRVYGKLEGQGFQGNLAGMPITRAPLSLLRAEAMSACSLSEPLDAAGQAKVAAWITTATGFLTDFMANHVKTPDLGLLLDSAPYLATKDGGTTPSSVFQWSMDVVKATGLSLPEIASAINRGGREMARVMNTEWMLMGDGEGARAVHGDKTTMFLMGINSQLGQVGYYATAQLAHPMTELNGFDAETCTPRLRPQPIPMESIEAVCNALKSLSGAGKPIPPKWEGTNVILARAELPPFPEMDEDAMLGGSRGGKPADPTITPEGTAGGKKPAGEPKHGDSEANDDNPGTGAT